MKFIYPAVFHKTEHNTYTAFFPDLEGCYAAGDTLEEAVENANEAAAKKTFLSPPSPTSGTCSCRKEMRCATSVSTTVSMRDGTSNESIVAQKANA